MKHVGTYKHTRWSFFVCLRKCMRLVCIFAKEKIIFLLYRVSRKECRKLGKYCEDMIDIIHIVKLPTAFERPWTNLTDFLWVLLMKCGVVGRQFGCDEIYIGCPVTGPVPVLKEMFRVPVVKNFHDKIINIKNWTENFLNFLELSRTFYGAA